MLNFLKKKKKTNDGISSPYIHVVICRLMSDRTPIVVAEFDAVQEKDKAMCINLVNHDLSFKEELDMKKHHILSDIEYKLNLNKLSREKKLEMIKNKIIELENRVKQVKDGKIGDLKVNVIDLKVDIDHLRVLKYVVEQEGEGSYEIMNKDNQREIRYLARDGTFEPYFYRSDTGEGKVLSMYPNMALSKKYWKEIDEKIEDRYLENMNSNPLAGIKGVVLTVAFVVLLVGNMFWASRNFENAQTIDEKLASCRAKCENSATDCAYYYGKLLQDEIINRSITVDAPPPPQESIGEVLSIDKIAQKALE